MRWRWGWLGVLGLAAAGCSEPTGVVPVGPPGVEFVRVPPPPEGEGPQALGEQAVQQAGAEPSTTPAAPASPDAMPVSEPTKPGEVVTTPAGLIYETVVEGTGDQIRPGQTAVVHYTGTLTDGKKFDSSRDRGEPFSFTIGQGQVIQGWDLGVAGMKVGEQRKLTIPPDLGYGQRGAGNDIPPGATLLFDVELVGIK